MQHINLQTQRRSISTAVRQEPGGLIRPPRLTPLLFSKSPTQSDRGALRHDVALAQWAFILPQKPQINAALMEAVPTCWETAQCLALLDGAEADRALCLLAHLTHFTAAGRQRIDLLCAEAEQRRRAPTCGHLSPPR